MSVNITQLVCDTPNDKQRFKLNYERVDGKRKICTRRGEGVSARRMGEGFRGGGKRGTIYSKLETV